jgi:signal transduction histidine kinase
MARRTVYFPESQPLSVRRLSGPSARALDVSFGERRSATTLAAPLGPTATEQAVVAATLVPMIGVTMWLGLTSHHLQRPVAATLYWSFLILASTLTGLVWWARRPASRFGPLLIGFAVLVWIVSWQAANSALAFDIGVLAEAPAFVLTFYLFLAFPTGRLEPAAARWIMAALGVVVVAFFLPWALFAPVIAGGGPLTRCALNCPQNVLQVGTAPGLVDVAGKAETYTTLAIAVAAAVVYLARLRAASRPQRRALMAVACTSLLFLPAYFVFNFAAWILHLDQGTLDTLAWGIVGTRILLPLGFLLALLQAERFAVTALGTLLQRLAARPTPAQWRDTIAEALDDQPLQLAYRDPTTDCFREADGAELTPPPAPSDRAWVPVARDGEPVAAMIVDETLTQDPELVRSAASATLLAVENGALEGELRESRARILEAGHEARRRIERDLHDSAQQRLIALRIHLTLAGERVEHEPERAELERLGLEVDQTIDELRDLAQGAYPQVLARAGLGGALRAAALRSSIPVSVQDAGLRRHTEALETTAYFCCLEGLQNAAKHAGPDVAVTIRLSENGGGMRFSVADDGTGFDPASVERSSGLMNIRDRVAAVGGIVTIDAAPGRGTVISAELPD